MGRSFVSTTSIRLEVQGKPTPCNKGYIKKLLVLQLAMNFLSYLRNTRGSIQRPEGYIKVPTVNKRQFGTAVKKNNLNCMLASIPRVRSEKHFGRKCFPNLQDRSG
jgi:hypothetical protein